MLARPVRRWEFIVGKFSGLVQTLIVNALLMTVGFYAALFYVSHRLTAADLNPLVAIYFIMLQFVIITSLALLFSTFSTPILSAIFSFLMFVIGTFAEDLRNFAAISHGFTHWATTVTAYIVPNFASLNIISLAAHDQAVGNALVWQNTLYAVLYAGSVLCGSVLIFERRNFK